MSAYLYCMIDQSLKFDYVCKIAFCGDRMFWNGDRIIILEIMFDKKDY